MLWMDSVLGLIESLVVVNEDVSWKAWKEMKNVANAAADGAPTTATLSTPKPCSGDNLILDLLQEQKVEYYLYDHPESKTAQRRGARRSPRDPASAPASDHSLPGNPSRSATRAITP